MVRALDFQAGYRGFESRSGRDNFQTISTSSSYTTCLGLSIKWTGWRLVTESGTECAWVIHGSKAVQIHVHNNRRCHYVPRVPGSVKNPHNNNNASFIHNPGNTASFIHNPGNTRKSPLYILTKGEEWEGVRTHVRDEQSFWY